MLRSKFIFLAALSLFSCSDDKSDEPTSPPPVVITKDPTSLPEEKRTHCLPLPAGWPNPWPCLPKPTKPEQTPSSPLTEAINKERAAKGLALVVEDKKIVCAAAKHAQEIAARKNCSHVGADSSSFVERLSKCGFTVNGGSEVIACGQGDPQKAVDAFMKSLPHRMILLDGKNKRIGTAVSNGYWVAVFSPN